MRASPPAPQDCLERRRGSVLSGGEAELDLTVAARCSKYTLRPTPTKRKNCDFSMKKCDLGTPIMFSANYAARASFHVMDIQDPMRTSSKVVHLSTLGLRAIDLDKGKENGEQRLRKGKKVFLIEN